MMHFDGVRNYMNNENKRELSDAEWLAALQLYIAKREYHENCNDSYLAQLIRRNADDAGNDLAQCTRDFIADVIEGNITREIGAGNKWDRDFEIGCKIYSLRRKGMNLTSQRYVKGNYIDSATSIIAKEYGISAGAARKIYDRIKLDIEKMQRIDYDAWLGFEEDNPKLFP
jgi:hypothetical protein